MFEYISRKRDPVSIVFYCGIVPFGIYWALRQSPTAGFALQAYLVTMAAFVFGPFEVHKKHTKEWWFWKATLSAGAIVHPVLLAVLWYLDMTYPFFVTGTGTVFLVGILAGVIETVVVGEITLRFRPDPTKM